MRERERERDRETEERRGAQLDVSRAIRIFMAERFSPTSADGSTLLLLLLLAVLLPRSPPPLFPLRLFGRVREFAVPPIVTAAVCVNCNARVSRGTDISCLFFFLWEEAERSRTKR